MDKLLASAIGLIEKYWYRRFTIVVVALALLLFGYWQFIPSHPENPVALDWCLAAIPALLAVLVWVRTQWLPRASKSKIGIVIAIDSDDETHAKQVEADFISSLRRLIAQDTASNFQLITFPSRLVAELSDSVTANKLLRRSRGAMLLYGDVRKRKIRGHETHILRLDGWVRHANIDEAQKRELSTDFRNVIPERSYISVDNDALAFEAASEWIEVGAKYVVGMATFVSGNAATAERLFLDVEKRLANASLDAPPVRSLARKLPVWIMRVYESWHFYLIDKWIAGRDQEDLRLANEIAIKILERQPRAYSAYITRSIAEFTLFRNMDEARRLTRLAKGIGSPIWLYNLAFLDAYAGDLKSAKKHYREAFSRRLENVTVPIQCEEFMLQVLADEPDKIQLLYCTGLINYHVKRDCLRVTEDLERFVSDVRSEAFPSQVVEANRLIENCRKRSET